MIVTPRYLSVPSKRRSGLRIPKVGFLVAHDTGNSGSTAAQNVAYYARTAQEQSASAHIFVDDKEILECVPALTGPAEKAWHVNYDKPQDNTWFGDDANDIAIGVELCFGGSIDFAKAYANYVWVLAELCRRYQVNPQTHIAGHFQLDPQRRTDPENALGKNGKSFAQLLLDVMAAVQGTTPHPAPAFPQSQTVQAGLNVRTQPNTHASVINVLPVGSQLTATASQKGERVYNCDVWYTDGKVWWWGGAVK